MDQAVQHRIVAGAVAAIAVLGAGAVASAAVGTGPFAASDDVSGTTPTTLPDDQPGTDLPVGATQTFPVGDAGFVTVTRDTDGLHIVTTTAADGWTAQLGDDTGREVRVTFTNADGRQTTFKVELEHGGVQAQVENEVARGDDGAADEPGHDNSGPGSLNSGPGSVNSGPGSLNSGPDSRNSGPGSVGDDGSGPGATLPADDATGAGSGGGFDDGPNHDIGDDHGGSGSDGSESGSGHGGSGSGGGSGHGGSSGPG